jgi:sigma-B regulation protein RsbU (phosphoserine phosphatase)
MTTRPSEFTVALGRYFAGIRAQLWLAVNVPLAVLLVVFLVYDYHRELSGRWEDKRNALNEEAKTLLPAVLQIRNSNPTGVQSYINSVCERMRDDESPGHHIAVVLGDHTYQSSAHHRPSSRMLQLMQTAAGTPAFSASEQALGMIVGSCRQGDSAAYVAERIDNIRRAVVTVAIRRVFGILFLALVGLGALNIVLSLVVIRPLTRLVRTVQAIGGGKLDATAGRFATAELNCLAGEIDAMSQSLAKADRERTSQLRKAKLVQENLLPNRITTAELRTDYLFRPVDSVAGDYVDVLRLPDGSWLLCIADATGHGVPAALNAVMVKTLLLLAAERLHSPAEMLHFLNERLLAMSLTGDFVSMLLVRYQSQHHLVEVSSAGHEPAWLMAPDTSVRKITSTGPLVGISESATWENEKFEVQPGERLLMVTDGVTETMDSHRNCFGRERLASLYVANRERSLQQTIEILEADARAFRASESQHDDFTLLIAEFGDAAESAPQASRGFST